MDKNKAIKTLDEVYIMLDTINSEEEVEDMNKMLKEVIAFLKTT